MKTEKFYAYQIPNGDGGICLSWEECSRHVLYVPGARYKAFMSRDDALAFLGYSVPTTRDKNGPVKVTRH